MKTLDHINSTRMRKNFSEDLFLENTIYIWKCFVLNIRANSSRPLSLKKLFCSHTAMAMEIIQALCNTLIVRFTKDLRKN